MAPPCPDGDTLVLGPLLRYVDDTSATVWVRTADAARVTVARAGSTWTAPTFRVHGAHYALVVCDGLEPGTDYPYEVHVDGIRVWPLDGAAPSRIRTPAPGHAPRFAFGSCRTSAPHDAAGNDRHGVDALRSLAIALRDDPGAHWPDLLLLLGDQVYADTTPHPELEEYMRARRDLDEPPGAEIKDFVEYAELYRIAWSEPVIRWVLSSVPSAMIFDDHDVRDDWNTSWSWREEIRRTTWWQERIVAGLGSYWVHQHLGNLAPADLAEEEVWQQVAAHAARGSDHELDLTEAVDALAERADARPDSYRWSYARELGDCLLLVVDSRAARDLQPDSRSMLDAEELRWLDGKLRGGYRHVFVGTSLPFLLPPGLHDVEVLDEAVAEGCYGRRPAALAERVRRRVDLEHWAAFTSGFDEVFEMVADLARGNRGAAPDTVVFLSGDVHNSYLAEVVDPGQHRMRSRIVQAVCSPIRNPMPRGIRVGISLLSRWLARPVRALVARSAHVSRPQYPWQVTEGPWFDNCIATCRVDDRGLELSWLSGVVQGDVDRPTLRAVHGIRLDVPHQTDDALAPVGPTDALAPVGPTDAVAPVGPTAVDATTRGPVSPAPPG
ncbi:MAG: alkaline phosphatase D family protein [Dermatophilaceae bacterium]